jgi:biopolymer transport protein ExbD
MKIRNTEGSGKGVELQMTPMIDIVFQLLIFFIMTFKIASLEGDFNIKMPLVSQGQGNITDQTLLPLTLTLSADSAGNLNQILLNERTFDISSQAGGAKGGFDKLHEYVISYMGDDPNRRESTELEIVVAYHLHYEYTVMALTAVRGRRNPDGTIKDLITNIKFAPPDKDPDAG